MTYKVTEEGNISTVFLQGEIDMDVTDKAKEVIMPLVEAKKEVHLNLKEVQYIDSSGISVLIESHQKANVPVTDLDIISYAAGPGLGPCLRVGAVGSKGNKTVQRWAPREAN